MRQELIKQAKDLFDTPDKWNAFLELVSQKDEIRNQWYQKLKDESNKRFRQEDTVETWGFNTFHLWDMQWYLSKYGPNSICFYMGWWGEFTLFSYGGNNDIIEASKLLKQDKFAPLLKYFHGNSRFFDNDRFAIDSRSFSFGSPYDGRFDLERLAWYAGNKTDEFLDQIADKINKYRKDNQLTILLDELNMLTLKNKIDE